MYLYNSLTRKLEKFVSIEKNNVKIYVCGITPYDTTHLGHAFTYISFDALIKYLKFIGFDVNYTQNVTDINDRDNDILKRAQEQKISWENLAKFWTDKFLKEMNDLNWTKPNNYLFASENISPIVGLIQKLIQKNLAYEKSGSIYLDISKFPDFGKLSRLTDKEMLDRAKDFEEDVYNPDKKNPLDVTLWRTTSENQPKHIPSFQSPWGFGRPGWHMECSAMVIESLGNQIDIHGGGIDLIFPHHEAEVAQSEGATDKIPFAKFWIHVGMVAYKKKKMSKSDNNLVMISDLLKTNSADAIRFLLLSNHYRKPWEFHQENLDKTQEIIDQILSKLKNVKVKKIDFESCEIRTFKNLMDNDLDTPEALNYIKKIANNSLNYKTKQALLIMLRVLGFSL